MMLDEGWSRGGVRCGERGSRTHHGGIVGGDVEGDVARGVAGD